MHSRAKPSRCQTKQPRPTSNIEESLPDQITSIYHCLKRDLCLTDLVLIESLQEALPIGPKLEALTTGDLYCMSLRFRTLRNRSSQRRATSTNENRSLA